MEQSKYYTPEIEDVHVGYECEVYKQNTTKLIKSVDWHSVKVDIGSEVGELVSIGECKKLIRNNHIRTPYLTREQIESEGFIINKDNDAYTDFKHSKPEWNLRFWKDMNNQFKNIELSCVQPELNYTGPVKSINEFRTIQKLLGIK